jgi:hypothetical protein
MKIRNGFVSNSSSSSFIVIGTKLNSREKEDLYVGYFPDNNQNVWVRTHNYLSDGEEFFKLLPEMTKHLPNIDHYDWDFYKVVDMVSEVDCSIKPEHLGCVAFAIEADYWQPNTEKEFIRRYVEVGYED